jgi:tyrosyl-tRNA synthetase
MPLLEGIDGVQKMSKSFGNYVGITEPPLEMFGKLMSISDDLMWRYWELLTDTSMSGIETMKDGVGSGRIHPMIVKKGLATKIVADFHGEPAAKDAAENWARIFQKDEVPETVEHVRVRYADVAASHANSTAIKLDKLLVQCGLADSVSDGLRKVRAKAVRIDGNVKSDPIMPIKVPAEFTLRVGRLLKRVTVA